MYELRHNLVAKWLCLYCYTSLLYVADNQTSHQSQFGNYYLLHNNAATPPPSLYSIEEYGHSLPWDAGTRGASAQRTSGKSLCSFIAKIVLMSDMLYSGGPTTI